MPTALQVQNPQLGGRERILVAATELFAQSGYHATSIRDIARAVGVTVGAIYAHFASKSEILLTAYAQGVERVIKAVDDATATADEPWERLEAACRAHLDLLLYAGGLAQVVVRVQPDDVPDAAADLVALRDRYEKRFRAIVSDLDLAPHIDRRLFRLTLMGALNWSKTWYRPGGTDTGTIARQIVETLRHGATTPQAAP